MEEETIGQRIKYVITALNLKVRTFAQAVGISETNVRNYLDRGTKPSSDIIERIVNTFPQVNTVWLITGQGKPIFTLPAESSSGPQKNAHSKEINPPGPFSYPSGDCEKDLAAANEKIALLTSQLADKERIIQLLERSGK